MYQLTAQGKQIWFQQELIFKLKINGKHMRILRLWCHKGFRRSHEGQLSFAQIATLMDTDTLAEPNGNYLESVQAPSVLACAREKFFLSFSVTRATQRNYSLLCSHTFLSFMCNTNSTPLRTTHASFDITLSVPQAPKIFPLVSSNLISSKPCWFRQRVYYDSSLFSVWWTRYSIWSRT